MGRLKESYLILKARRKPMPRFICGETTLRRNALERSTLPKDEEGAQKVAPRENGNGRGNSRCVYLPGIWDVLAYRDGFAPVCTVVSVEAGKPTTIRTAVSPLCGYFYPVVGQSIFGLPMAAAIRKGPLPWEPSAEHHIAAGAKAQLQVCRPIRQSERIYLQAMAGLA
jgi:hypothetical protein